MWKLRGKEKPDTLKEGKGVDTPAEKARQMKAAILSKESKPSEDPEPAPEDIPKPLPPGWQVAMDPKSGKQYFYNKKLKISQWDRPCEQDPEIEPPPATPSKSALSEHELKAYEIVEEEITSLCNKLSARIKLSYASGDKMEALGFHQENKYYSSVLEWLQKRKEENLAVPAHRIIPRVFQSKDQNINVPVDKLQARIFKVNELPKGSVIELKVAFLWPKEQPQVYTSKAIEVEEFEKQGGLVGLFHAKITNSLQRYASHKFLKVSVEVVVVEKSFLRTKRTMMGKTELELSRLMTSSSFREPSFELFDPEKGKKKVPCSLDIECSIQKPWDNKERVRTEKDRLFVFEDSTAPARSSAIKSLHDKLIAATEKLPGAPTQEASRAAATSSASKSAARDSAKLDSLYTQAKKLFLSSTARLGMTKEQLEGCERGLVKAQELLRECKKLNGGRDFRNTNEMLSHISKRLNIRTLPVAGADARTTPGKENPLEQEQEQEDSEEEDLDAVGRLKSLDVMERELNLTCERLQRKEGDEDELNFRKGELETAIEFLQTQVETEVLTEEVYRKRVRDAIAREQRARKKLLAQHRVKDAERVLSWIKTMCEELEMEIPPDPQLPAQQIRACGNHPMAYSIAGGAEAKREEDGDEEDELEEDENVEIEIFDEVAEIASCDVLEYEQKLAEEKRKKLPAGHEEIEDLDYRLDEIADQLRVLHTSINYDAMSLSSYLSSLRSFSSKCERERERYQAQGEREKAARLTNWIRITQHEITSAPSGEHEQGTENAGGKEGRAEKQVPARGVREDRGARDLVERELGEDELDEDEDEDEDMSGVVSYEVMEYEMKKFEDAMRTCKNHDEMELLQFRIEDLRSKMQLLETNIACDVIDQDMYRRNLQLAIKQEEERAKRMLKKQNKQAAQNAVMRIKIMKAELTASS